MLSSLLSRSGLGQYYPEGPPELSASLFPVDNLPVHPGFLLMASFLYHSEDMMRYPHHLCLQYHFLDQHTPTLGLDDRVTIRVAKSVYEPVTEESEFLILEAWVVGIHFEVIESVEFTLLGMFDGLLQVVFLEVPQRFVDRVNTLPNTMRYNRIWYWTYLPSIAIEARAKVLQSVDDDLEEWSFTYRSVHHTLMELRTRGVAHFVGVEFACFEKVSISYSELSWSDLTRLVGHRDTQTPDSSRGNASVYYLLLQVCFAIFAGS